MNVQTLLTGFGPFGSIISNPAQRLVEHFAQVGAPGHDLTTLLVPVSYTEAPRLIDAVLATGGGNGRPFDNVVMIGVADSSLFWRIESVGRHREDGREDIDGRLPEHDLIVPDEERILPCTWPSEALVEALHHAELPAGLSDDAGAYLCNHLLYVGLRLLKQASSAARTGFLHVPADEETFAPNDPRAPRFTFAQQATAVNVILQVLR